jgi:hypothetical protein
MPFTFQPLQIKRQGENLELRGRLLTGAYFGPESVVVRSRAGDERATQILSHGLEYPEGWPVLPEHRNTTLVLCIPTLPPDFEIALLTGTGSAATTSERVDVTGALEAPEFWAIQALLHFASDEVDDPGQEWFGLSSDTANEWYQSNIDRHILAGRWPYLRVPLTNSRYIELEMAGGVEYQDRVWIGDHSSTQRVLMGYHSGHFSLPALRVSEVTWLAEQTGFSASNLLWFSTTYLEEGFNLKSLIEKLVSAVPGLSRNKVEIMSEIVLENLAVDGLSWTRDPNLGWVNNWPYSQRNPASLLSTLKPADFAYIQQFFT